jgi:hypothetical protein
MCWLRRVGTDKTGCDGGRSRIEEPRKPTTIDPTFGFIRGIQGFLGLRYRWE